ncbi:hypothetical protein [Aedoeadaptatus acetigenes]|uniref:hypothetical protein n=1 Tax=Aedoeadaptatus acetigenes TaxID=2981723 RepID=UPI0011DE44E5|nr:hypothetical protein [Aedoeadaptatus acetigenes]MCU6786421.1 hypothetical protein [Aedoeadaptatus acetigenes]
MKYNLTPFNISGVDTQEPLITMHCSATLELSVNSYADISLSMTGTNQVGMKALLSGGTPVEISFDEEITSSGTITSACAMQFQLNEKLHVNGWSSEDIMIEDPFEEEMNCDVCVSEDIAFDNDFIETFDSVIILDKFIDLVIMELSENLGINTQSTILDLTIIPVYHRTSNSKRVTVNSENYTVYYDGKNILDSYASNEWIEIGRDTKKISVYSYSNIPVKGRLIYKERFL